MNETIDFTIYVFLSSPFAFRRSKNNSILNFENRDGLRPKMLPKFEPKVATLEKPFK